MTGAEEPDARAAGVNAVGRALDILSALADNPQGLTLVQVSERTGLPRSTVHRIVQTLLEYRMVRPHERGAGFRLGPEIARIAAVTPSRVIPLARPFLEQLSQGLQEGASLTVLEGNSIRFLDQVISGNGLRAVSLVGSTYPAYCTANGKALLARLGEPALLAVLPGKLARRTPHTITSRARLLEELEQIREQGYAFDREEHALGICAVGAVAHDAVGNAAAVAVAMPAHRFYEGE
jgi:DNA-binding IclR family transcriptional regulator